MSKIINYPRRGEEEHCVALCAFVCAASVDRTTASRWWHSSRAVLAEGRDMCAPKQRGMDTVASQLRPLEALFSVCCRWRSHASLHLSRVAFRASRIFSRRKMPNRRFTLPTHAYACTIHTCPACLSLATATRARHAAYKALLIFSVRRSFGCARAVFGLSGFLS